jgi:hypothetical protein
LAIRPLAAVLNGIALETIASPFAPISVSGRVARNMVV